MFKYLSLQQIQDTYNAAGIVMQEQKVSWWVPVPEEPAAQHRWHREVTRQQSPQSGSCVGRVRKLSLSCRTLLSALAAAGPLQHPGRPEWTELPQKHPDVC